MNMSFTTSVVRIAPPWPSSWRGAVWFVVGTLYGLFSAIHLVAPEFFNNIPWLVFGRTRPIHVNTVIYGFVSGTLIGCGVYYVPALLQHQAVVGASGLAQLRVVERHRSERAGRLLVRLSARAASTRNTSGRRTSCLVAAILTMLLNVIMTILQSARSNVLYVSVWYFVGTFLWTAWSYPIGNVMWHPAHGGGKRPAGFDLPVVLRPQPGGSDPDAAGGRRRVLRDSVHHEHPSVLPHALAHRVLDFDRILFAHRGASHPAGADSQLAQGGLHRGFAGDGDPGLHGAGQPVADGAGPGRGAAAASGGPLRSGRDDLVPADLHPGPAAIAAEPAEGDALQQLDHRPLAHRRAGVQRLHRAGSHVARRAADHRPPGLFGQAGLRPVLADHCSA